MTVFAPVAGEGAVDTCQAAAGGKWTVRSRGVVAFISIMGPGVLLLFGVPAPLQRLFLAEKITRPSACCTGLVENGLAFSGSLPLNQALVTVVTTGSYD